MTAFWQVPYVGQVGAGANEHGNDCGPTAAAMILKYYGAQYTNIDDLFNEVKPNTDVYTSFGDLSKILSRRGIDVDYASGMTILDLYKILQKKKPVIALIRYGALNAIRPNLFKGMHFVVVTGVDMDTVYINDPLNYPTTGENVAVPFDLWTSAWGDSQSLNSCLIPGKIDVIADPDATVLRTVYPKDKIGCWVRSRPNDVSAGTRLRGVIYDPSFTNSTSRMYVYEIQEFDSIYKVWGRIHPTKQEWVCLDYTIQV